MSDSKKVKYSEISGSMVNNLVKKIKAVGSASYVGNTVTVSDADDGVTTNRFFANSNMVKITADITGNVESVCIWLGIIKNDDSEDLYRILDGASPGKLEVTFDAANYIVYSDAKEFRVIINTASSSGTFTVNSLDICELSGIQQSEYYNSDFEPMMKNVMDSLGLLQSASVPKAPTVVNPDGRKFTLSIDSKGSIFAIPHIPSKVVFIGNSLLLGMGFYGMCASSPQNDYAYYVEQAVLENNPNAEFVKLYGSKFEMSETEEIFEEWWNKEINKGSGKTVKDSFGSDTELTIIQLGDNVNNPSRVKGLAKNIEKLISGIRKTSSKARIIWVLGWYNRSNSYGIISSVCTKWNIPIVDISDINIKENQAFSGQECVLADGTKGKVKDGWITHPGDKGMKLIAERIIKAIDM